jgi:hypothetical protein
MSSGEEKVWEALANLDPGDVCRRAQTVFDRAEGLYTLKSFNRNISVSPRDKKFFSSGVKNDALLQRLGYFSRLSFLWYLVNAKDIPLSGKFVRPADLKGGQLFFRGTHVIPLERLAEIYCSDIKGFIMKGKGLGAEKLTFGDASIKLLPLPRVPVVLILWGGDEEFPARADLLFDSSCEFHLPLDIIWSVAMMSVLIMM